MTLAYQGTELLERTTIRMGQGRRYGLIGPNGVGKTTLLRRIAAGAVPGWPLHLRSYLVQQEEMVGVATFFSPPIMRVLFLQALGGSWRRLWGRMSEGRYYRYR